MGTFAVMFLIIGGFVVWYLYAGSYTKNLHKKGIAGKAEEMLKRDAASDYAKCKFYAFHDYNKEYKQNEWLEFYKERVTSKTWDTNSQEYAEAVAPFINAIVVNEYGFYIRRGLESPSFTRFLPGVNDRVSSNSFVEPYEYVQNKELAAKSLAEEALRKEQYERERPEREARAAAKKAAQQERERRDQEIHAAFERCRGCANNLKCSPSVRRVPGACGGYTPK